MTNPRITAGTIDAVLAHALPINSLESGLFGDRDWVVRTPKGLIAGDSTERNAWHVSAGGKMLFLSVPDYLAPGVGYSVTLRLPGPVPTARRAIFDVTRASRLNSTDRMEGTKDGNGK